MIYYFPQDATVELLDHLRAQGAEIPLCFSPPSQNEDQHLGFRRLRDRRFALTSDINEAIRRRHNFNDDTGTAGNRANYEALVKVRKQASALARTLAGLSHRAGLERRWPSPALDYEAEPIPSLTQLQAVLQLLATKAEESARYLDESGLLGTDILTLASRELQAKRLEYINALPQDEQARALAEPQPDTDGPLVRLDGRIVATPLAAFLLGLEDAFKAHLVYPSPDDDHGDAILLVDDEDLCPEQRERKAKLLAWRPTFTTSEKGRPPDPYTSFVLWISDRIGEPTTPANIRIAHSRIPSGKTG